MKTEVEVKKDIETLIADLTNTVSERNLCIQKEQELIAKINYLSGKIDALKGLDATST